MKRFFGKKDAIIVLAIGLAAVLSLAAGHRAPAAQTAQVIIDNEVFSDIDLQGVENPYRMTLPSQVEIEISRGEVKVIASVCRDKLCVHSGALTKDGDIAVCLPQKTLIRVSGRPQENSPDAITY